ncbi:MAG TPA: hypothetical protein VI953_02385 [Candidatus Paceibacterota bacterium]
MNKIKIAVNVSLDGKHWIATIPDEREPVFGGGRTVAEAVGEIVIAYKRRLQLEIEIK